LIEAAVRHLNRGQPRPSLRLGVDHHMYDFPPHTGYGRVWTEVLPKLGELAEIVTADQQPDVWIADGHSGDPGVEGPVVACVYEVNWGTPEFDREHAPGFVDTIAPLTEAGVMRADHIVTGALTSKHQIVRAYGVPPERVHVVPFGVNLATFHPDDRTVGRTLVRERVGEDRPYVLFAASLHPRKNLGAVRQAVTGLAERGWPHVLVLVAAPAPDRPDSSDLEAEALAELPGFPGRVVRFIDPSDQELSALMSGADAVCQPSTSEGFGLTPLEAMATGAAVVVSNRGSLPEVVGRGGSVVEPTAAAVEEALLDLVRHPRAAKRLRARALRRARRLTWDRTAEGWLRVAARAAREPHHVARHDQAG
jgi:glycosyltransferase involved in cell wall biosynthesis